LRGSIEGIELTIFDVISSLIDGVEIINPDSEIAETRFSNYLENKISDIDQVLKWISPRFTEILIRWRNTLDNSRLVLRSFFGEISDLIKLRKRWPLLADTARDILADREIIAIDV
jgi:hypothetical protein